MLGMVAHAYNPSNLGAEVDGSLGVPVHLGLRIYLKASFNNYIRCCFQKEDNIKLDTLGLGPWVHYMSCGV